MYAVIKTGGKQYKVAPGEVLKIEKLNINAGETVTFDEVLMVGEGEACTVGLPLVKGARVEAEVLSQGRAPKIRIIKFKRRKHHMKHQGHRQYYTEVKITNVIAA